MVHVARPFHVSALCSLAALAALAALTAPAAAQTTLAEYQLSGPLGEVGPVVGDAGDVNGDGVHDLIVGGPSVLLTYSGADFSILPGTITTAMGLLNGGGVGIQDLNGGGLRDIVSMNFIDLRTFARETGAMLWNVGFLSPTNAGGRNIAVLPDVTGDGIEDIAFGEPVTDIGPSGGVVRIISGASGSVFRQFNAPSGNNFGISVAPAADADGDGWPDLLVGQTGYLIAGTKFGRVLLISSQTGAILHEVVGDALMNPFGIGAFDGGDLDADGVHDIVARGFAGQEVRVRAYSGADNEVLWTTNVPLAGSGFIVAGDVNGDGFDDYVLSRYTGGGPAGSATVLSGLNGAVLGTVTGTSAAQFLTIAAPGDLDGDGTLELLAGAKTPGVGLPLDQHADIFRLPGGPLLHTISNPANKMGLGNDVALAGDLNADGLSDVAALGSTHLVAFDRASGASLFISKLPIVQFPLSDGIASALAAPGDLSGDGVPDLIVGDGNEINVTNGRILTVSGADGHVLAMLDGTQFQENFGHWVQVTDDRNGDGVRDVWVSAEGMLVSGQANAGEVRLYSGASLAGGSPVVLATRHGAVQANAGFGQSLSVGGDIDGDGVQDIAVGSKETIVGVQTGALYVLSGATGAQLWRFDGDMLSNGVTGLITGDANGDDVPDVLAVETCWNSCKGRARLFSGATGALLWTALGGAPVGGLGRRMSPAGDVNGDGRADVALSDYSLNGDVQQRVLSGLDGTDLDTLLVESVAVTQNGVAPAGLVDAGGCGDLLVGEPSHDDNGSVRVLASSKGGVHGFIDVGFAKAGSNGKVPTLRGYGNLAAGSPVTISARHALPLAPSVWFVGLSPAYVPFKQGTLVPSPFGFFVAIVITTDATGAFSITANNPAGVFAGLELWHQMWFKDVGVPSGVSATNGMDEIFK